MKSAPWQLLAVIVAGWISDQQQAVIEYLSEENRVLREKLGVERVRLNDNQRRRVAAKGKVLGRRRLAEVCSIVTPDTILRWHRRLNARKSDGSAKRRPGVMPSCSNTPYGSNIWPIEKLGNIKDLEHGCGSCHWPSNKPRLCRFKRMNSAPWELLAVIVAGWMSRQQQEAIEYLGEENQVLREKLGVERIRLNDDQRRWLAAKGRILGRRRDLTQCNEPRDWDATERPPDKGGCIASGHS